MKDRKLLMIPGPIEFTPDVLQAMGMPTTSHVAPNFIEVFGQALERLRQVFLCPSGQPFIIAGSGTLAMDIAAANLIEPGDKALVVNTGYFSDRFATILERYGAAVTEVHAAAIGDAPGPEEVETILKKNRYKLMTITHVDTSTAVAADVKAIAALGREYGALVVVDGVCSVAGEEMRRRWTPFASERPRSATTTPIGRTGCLSWKLTRRADPPTLVRRPSTSSGPST